ncbi:MAG: hypothetical protein ACJ74Z_19655 [Bryobacteraceae bacterium]
MACRYLARLARRPATWSRVFRSPERWIYLTLAPDKSFGFPYSTVEKIANADEEYCEQVYKDLVDLAKA